MGSEGVGVAGEHVEGVGRMRGGDGGGAVAWVIIDEGAIAGGMEGGDGGGPHARVGHEGVNEDDERPRAGEGVGVGDVVDGEGRHVGGMA